MQYNITYKELRTNYRFDIINFCWVNPNKCDICVFACNQCRCVCMFVCVIYKYLFSSSIKLNQSLDRFPQFPIHS